MALIDLDVPDDAALTLIGRSSSSFTRITRIFAAELGVAHGFRIVASLTSLEAADYGGHPALKLPALEAPEGTWFGSLNICRAFARRARVASRVIWPEAHVEPITANALELTLAAMSTEVTLIMSSLGGQAEAPQTLTPHATKLKKSLGDTLAWLDTHLERVLDALPAERDLSYLEVALFCLVTHLEFRSVVPITPYPALGAFCERLAQRPSAEQTAYRFDV
jgi:glutathione S-transferase